MYVKSAREQTNNDRRIDAAIAHLDRIARIHRVAWQKSNVIPFPHQGRASR